MNSKKRWGKVGEGRSFLPSRNRKHGPCSGVSCAEIKAVALQMRQIHHRLHHSLCLWVTLRQLQKHLRTGPEVATQTSDHLHPAHCKAGTVRRDLQKMWGQSGWDMLCLRVPALLLLLVGTAVSTQDICSSRADDTLQPPVLILSTSRAQEGEAVLAYCFLQKIIPATRIVLCKDGLEEYTMKAQEDAVVYSMLLNVSARSSGTYTCRYQQRNESNWLRSSRLSMPLVLQVTGHGSISTAGRAPTVPCTLPDPTAIAVTSLAFTLLLSAATFWTIKKGACRERCQRHQHDPSQQMEATNYEEIQYDTIDNF